MKKPNNYEIPSVEVMNVSPMQTLCQVSAGGTGTGTGVEESGDFDLAPARRPF